MSDEAIKWMEKVLAWMSKYKKELVVLFTLFVVTMVTRLLATLAWPIEVGMDGAYYTINVTSLLTGGYLYYDAPIVSFAVAAGFSVLFQNVIVGVKVASAFFEALLCVGVFFAAWTFTDGDWRVAVVAGVLCWVDASQFQLVTSLLKNQAALAFLPFAFAFFYRYITRDRSRYDFVGYIIFGLLTTLSHLMTAALFFVTLIIFAGYEFILLLKNQKSREALRSIFIPLLISGIIFVGVYVAFDIIIPAADTWYSSSSLTAASSFTTSFLWGQSVISLLEFFLGPFALFPINLLSPQFLYLIGHALLIGVSVFVCLARNKKGDRAALALLFSTLLMGMGLASWSARFLAMYFVPASIVFGIGLVVLADRLAAYFKEKMISIQQIHHSQKIIALGLIAIMTTAILGWTTPILSQAMYKTRPIVRSSDLASIDALNGMFPNDVKLWATHGIEYFITSRTGYEAAPENGQADFPVLAALRMYNEITNNARESYHIADPSSHFYRSFHPIENDLLTVTSFDYFSMIESTFNITIQAKVPLYAIKLDIASSIEGAEEPEFHYSFWLMPRLGNIWTQEIDIRGLPEDTYAITITPFLNPPPRSPPKEDILGTFTEPIFIYRWDDLPRPHIHLEELITLYGTAGLYQIYSVNLTTAQAIDLLNRNTLRASLPPPPGPPIYYMYILTPLFYLTPIIGDLSNFVIILVFCPLMGLYWLSAGIALVVVVVRLKEKYWQESLSTGELSTE